MNLWHYTCDHGRAALGAKGTLLPAAQLTDRPVPWPGHYVWLTDLSHPIRDALGLTSNFIECDRMAHRYRALDVADVTPWTDVLRSFPPAWREDLEEVPGARPRHWFVSRTPVPVELAVIGAPS